MEKTLDCRGLTCPIPVVKAKKAFEEFHEDGMLTVIVDNETAVQNLTRLADHYQMIAHTVKTGDSEYEVRIAVLGGLSGAAGTPEKTDPAAAAAKAPDGKITVVLSSRTMGTGDDRLGASLMKAFIFALTNLDRLPDTILAYNGGAFLTTEGSDALEDLKKLEEAGVTIRTCGTCLDFYGIKDKLAVGEVTNMYEIAGTLEESAKVIRP